MFQQWTNAESILEYLAFAKRYITACEERYGHHDVEAILDSAHALMDQGVFRYRRPPRPSRARVLEKHRRREEHAEEDYSELWRTLPAGAEPPPPKRIWDIDEDDFGDVKLPEENVLYFLEKNSPTLKSWQREILRIVRHLAQYFYPQRQTKVMNEGCATFVHHTILNMMYDRGMSDRGLDPRISRQPHRGRVPAGVRRPALFGHQSLRARLRHDVDIKRICEQPTDEDRMWFPVVRGRGRLAAGAEGRLGELSRRELHRAVPVTQGDARSPPVRAWPIRPMRPTITVSAIHNENGYRRVRSTLARQYDVGIADPNIQVTGANLRGDRKLYLAHRMHRGVPLHAQTRDMVLPHLERLWGYDVVLEEVAET